MAFPMHRVGLVGLPDIPIRLPCTRPLAGSCFCSSCDWWWHWSAPGTVPAALSSRHLRVHPRPGRSTAIRRRTRHSSALVRGSAHSAGSQPVSAQRLGRRIRPRRPHHHRRLRIRQHHRLRQPRTHQSRQPHRRQRRRRRYHRRRRRRHRRARHPAKAARCNGTRSAIARPPAWPAMAPNQQESMSTPARQHSG